MHLAALRIDAGHHVFDDAVLAGGIHALEHQQHRPLAVGEQPLLPIGKLGDAFGEDRPHLLDIGRETESLGRVVIGELEMCRPVDPALLDDLGEIHGDLGQKCSAGAP